MDDLELQIGIDAKYCYGYKGTIFFMSTTIFTRIKISLLLHKFLVRRKNEHLSVTVDYRIYKFQPKCIPAFPTIFEITTLG